MAHAPFTSVETDAIFFSFLSLIIVSMVHAPYILSDGTKTCWVIEVSIFTLVGQD